MKLFAANCKVVRGQQRACLIDLQHQELRLIPLILADFLEEKCTYEALDGLSKNMLSELESLEMVLEIDDNERSFFPNISLEFDTPYTISNAILDYNSSSHYNLIDALKALESIRCPHIEIRFYDILNIGFLHEIGATLFDSTIDSIDLYIPYNTKQQFSVCKK